VTISNTFSFLLLSQLCSRVCKRNSCMQQCIKYFKLFQRRMHIILILSSRMSFYKYRNLHYLTVKFKPFNRTWITSIQSNYKVASKPEICIKCKCTYIHIHYVTYHWYHLKTKRGLPSTFIILLEIYKTCTSWHWKLLHYDGNYK